MRSMGVRKCKQQLPILNTASLLLNTHPWGSVLWVVGKSNCVTALSVLDYMLQGFS